MIRAWASPAGRLPTLFHYSTAPHLFVPGAGCLKVVPRAGERSRGPRRKCHFRWVSQFGLRNPTALISQGPVKMLCTMPVRSSMYLIFHKFLTLGKIRAQTVATPKPLGPRGRDAHHSKERLLSYPYNPVKASWDFWFRRYFRSKVPVPGLREFFGKN